MQNILSVLDVMLNTNYKRLKK